MPYFSPVVSFFQTSLDTVIREAFIGLKTLEALHPGRTIRASNSPIGVKAIGVPSTWRPVFSIYFIPHNSCLGNSGEFFPGKFFLKQRFSLGEKWTFPDFYL